MKCFFLLFITLLGTQYGVKEKSKEEKLQDFAHEKLFIEENSVKNYSTEIEEFSTVNESVEVSFKLEYPEFEANISEEDYFDVKNYRKTLRQWGKNYHQTNNERLLKNIDTSNMKNLYVSSYSPFVSFTTTTEELESNSYDTINTLIENNHVNSVYVNYNTEYASTLSSSMDFMGITYYLENNKCSGTGVKIGILETDLVDKTHSILSDATVTVNKRMFDSTGDHATQVASIIHTVAPEAELYSITIKNSPREEIDWFLDNDVDIVNCSYGELNPTGKYSSESAYMDYAVYTYKLTIVAAVGNEGEDTGYVANPALGYNVIGVGACTSRDNFASQFSSYKVLNGPSKPNIVAPGECMRIPGFDGDVYDGTSYSAPIISACIALLMQDYEQMRIHPEYVMSFLYANTKIDSYDVVASGFAEYNGSGCLNFDEFWWNYGLNVNDRIASGNSDWTKTMNIHLRAKQQYKISLCWLAKATGSTSGTKTSNLDMVLYDESGKVLTKSTSTVNNYELIYFEPTAVDAVYTMICSVNGSTIKAEDVGIYYRFDA